MNKPMVSKRLLGRGPDPRNADVRAVLARSGNQCAFPGCPHPIVNETGLFIAQLCHIEAAAPGGPRYNPTANDEERRSLNNLMLLCYRHHVETDDVETYPTSRMLEIKRAHEQQFEDRPFSAPASALAQITREAFQYWTLVDRANSFEHVAPDLRVEIDVNASELVLIEEVQRTLRGLSQVHESLTNSNRTLASEVRASLVECGYDPKPWDERSPYENPTEGRDWDGINLGLPNHMLRIELLVQQLKLRCLERELAADPSSITVRTQLETLRSDFLEAAKSWGVID